MNFFEHQEAARRNTRRLVFLYVLAVLGVIAAVDAVVAAAWLWIDFESADPLQASWSLARAWHAMPGAVLAWGAICTASLVLLVSLFHITRLAAGGEVVARMANAKRVATNSPDLLERRLVNVVEEMAIASGTRVPAVYVMDGEKGVNAFAAGYDVSHAVVAVTRGALETLNRDELQGVIAHEFSHILNGDMRLNVRMLGVLAGIVFIGAIGEFMLRAGGRSEKGAAPVIAIGVALLIIGYTGLVFSRLIKAAVSRQREFLADASSVQFTRNPDGLAGALDQIRAAPEGARIGNRFAEDMSHMYFGQSVRVWLGGVFDTHPALDERIRRVQPRFVAPEYRRKRPLADQADGPAEESARKEKAATVLATVAAAMDSAQPARRGGDIGAQWGHSAGESAAMIGTLDRRKIDHATGLLAALPEELRRRVHEPDDARAAMVALLLAGNDEVMKGQFDALNEAGLGSLGAAAVALAPLTRGIGPALQLPTIDLALATAKGESAQEKAELLRALEIVVNADRRVSVHEFVVLTLVRHQFAPGVARTGNRKLADLQAEANTLRDLIQHASGQGKGSPPTLAGAQAALEALKALAPLQKALLIKDLFATVTADGRIRVIEAELMRLVGGVLDCPLPPLLAEFDAEALAA